MSTRPSWDVRSLLGPPGLDSAAAGTALAALVDNALGRKIDLAETVVAPVPYEIGSIATAALLRVHGRDLDGEPWSIFVKVLQHPRHWPLLSMLPPDVAAEIVQDLPWRDEIEAWAPAFAGLLPDGMRTPDLYRAVDVGDDRLAVWMEDVAPSSEVWNLGRYARAARLLGRLNARGSTPDALASRRHPPGLILRRLAQNTLGVGGLGPLGDDALWRHPWLAPHADLRADLIELGGRIPALLDVLDTLPQVVPHGDACPQNLLVPADAPETFVLIDVMNSSAGAIGADLAQLAVGMVHAGEHRVAELPALHAVLGDAYLAGFADEGVVADAGEVELGYVATMLIRSGLTSVPYRLLDRTDDPVVEGIVAERIALSRFIAGVARPVVEKV
jgi:hypothetical protein